MVLSLLKRPSFWAALVTFVAYCDREALHGYWVYDDSGSVAKNPVVTGDVPLDNAFTRDFWGTPIVEVGSHKSFRPITTLTFRFNWWLAQYNGWMDSKTKLADTFGFNIVNLALHVVVTGLVTETSCFVFDAGKQSDLISQLLTGILFGIHPVHVEAVSNITSRGEVLMSLFFLLAFLSYASHIPNARRRTSKDEHNKQSSSILTTIRNALFIYIAPWFFMICSMFSKEQGATTLITLVVYDFMNNVGSIQLFFQRLKTMDRVTLKFVQRTVILAIETLAVVAFRIWLNGETKPDFIADQNPAGFAEDRFTRIFSVCWVHCLYIFDMIFPKYLCPDWSGTSIPLIESLSDERSIGPLLLWFSTGWCCKSLWGGPKDGASKTRKEARRILLIAFFAFLVSPFLLSSNLIVVVGLMKGDRVIYLPFLGFCLMEALAFKLVFCAEQTKTKVEEKGGGSTTSPKGFGKIYWLGHLLLMIQLVLLSRKTHERNLAWSHSVRLWSSAYEINPRSEHTMYNCGYELMLKQKYEPSELVMRPIGSARKTGSPSNTFVYAMALYNLNKIDEARAFVDEALEVIEEQKKAGGLRNTPGAIAKTESNLLVCKALILSRTDMEAAGRTVWQAVQVDPRSEYAVQQAQMISNRLEMLKKSKLV